MMQISQEDKNHILILARRTGKHNLNLFIINLILNKYGLESYQRTTKKDYDEVLEHLLNLAKYWEEIKKV